MTDKMTRAEAMEKLPNEVTADRIEFDPIHSHEFKMTYWMGKTKASTFVSLAYKRLVQAARDLLAAEDELPYRVMIGSNPGASKHDIPVAAFNTRKRADAWGVAEYGRLLFTITGPDDLQTVDHGEDEHAESKTVAVTDAFGGIGIGAPKTSTTAPDGGTDKEVHTSEQVCADLSAPRLVTAKGARR